MLTEAQHLDPFRDLVPAQPRYLDASREPGKLVKGWNLVVPEQVLNRAWAEVSWGGPCRPAPQGGGHRAPGRGAGKSGTTVIVPQNPGTTVDSNTGEWLPADFSGFLEELAGLQRVIQGDNSPPVFRGECVNSGSL